MNYKKELIKKIEKLLNSEIDVSEFEKNYYLFFIETVPDNALSDEEFDFFGEIQEKLDFVSEQPSDEERSYGYINHKEYIELLRKKMSSASSIVA